MTAGAGRRARLESELTAAEAATVAELAHALYVPADAWPALRRPAEPGPVAPREVAL